jgi:predicted nucleic acid-binding Zn ribbon protein
MTVLLPEHDHCRFCGNPVPFDQAFCSEECYWKEQARLKKEKQRNTLFVIVAIVGVAVIFLVDQLL